LAARPHRPTYLPEFERIWANDCERSFMEPI
jgi:hypothetical protein